MTITCLPADGVVSARTWAALQAARGPGGRGTDDCRLSLPHGEGRGVPRLVGHRRQDRAVPGRAQAVDIGRTVVLPVFNSHYVAANARLPAAAASRTAQPRLSGGPGNRSP